MSFPVLVKSYKTAVQQRLEKGQCKNTNFQPSSKAAYSSSIFQEDEKFIMKTLIRIQVKLILLFKKFPNNKLFRSFSCQQPSLIR